MIKKIAIPLIPLILFLLLVSAARAEEAADPKAELFELNDTVQQKRSELEELRDRIEIYKQQIANLQSQSRSLANELALLENRVVKTELDIKAINVEIESTTLEVDILDREIADKQERVFREREILADLIREIQTFDRRSTLTLIFSAHTFSDFYSQLRFLEDVQGRLQETMDSVQAAKAAQEQKREDREEHLASLETLRNYLEKKQQLLDDEQGTKAFLLETTRSSEARFQELLRVVREESQFVDAQLGKLQSELAGRLREFDIDFSGGALFSWPLPSRTLITTLFHDPTYPFRNIFEHSGIDMRASVGTPVLAAAPGIVAVARTGRLYGNYVAIVHANGFSTLYAHLSRIMVSPDQFVDRNATIGLSGGQRGSRGAGLSTGPHLHFEIRASGVPTNPLDYLISF